MQCRTMLAPQGYTVSRACTPRCGSLIRAISNGAWTTCRAIPLFCSGLNDRDQIGPFSMIHNTLGSILLFLGTVFIPLLAIGPRSSDRASAAPLPTRKQIQPHPGQLEHRHIFEHPTQSSGFEASVARSGNVVHGRPDPGRRVKLYSDGL